MRSRRNFVSQSRHFALLRLIWSVNGVKSHENRVLCGNSGVFIEIGKQSWIQSESTHGNHVHMAGDMNNNQMESFNGNTVRLREEATRGLKSEDSAILTGLRLYYNNVLQHQGLPGNMTPGEAAGIHIEGLNKWKTVIQAAAKSAIRLIPFVVPPMLQSIPAHEYVTVQLPPVTVIPAISAGHRYRRRSRPPLTCPQLPPSRQNCGHRSMAGMNAYDYSICGTQPG